MFDFTMPLSYNYKFFRVMIWTNVEDPCVLHWDSQHAKAGNHQRGIVINLEKGWTRAHLQSLVGLLGDKNYQLLAVNLRVARDNYFCSGFIIIIITIIIIIIILQFKLI